VERNGYKLNADMVCGRTVVDIGANVGAFSMLAAVMGATDVWAYEPHPASFAALQSNVGAAPIRVRNQAVVGAQPDGPLLLMRDGGAAGLGGEGHPDYGMGGVEVDTITG
jgi:predicted nicotinamide N-methyase